MGQATFTFSLIIAVATKCSASSLTPYTQRFYGDPLKMSIRSHQSPAPNLRWFSLSFVKSTCHYLTFQTSFFSLPPASHLSGYTDLPVLPSSMGLFLPQPAPRSGLCSCCSFHLAFFPRYPHCCPFIIWSLFKCQFLNKVFPDRPTLNYRLLHSELPSCFP